jgi:hypothetical protein
MKNREIKCSFTSEWSDGSVVTTPCVYDPKTGEVTPEVSKGRVPTGTLEREFITLPGDEEIEVCNTCHEYVVRSAMVPGAGDDTTLEEVPSCMNPECDDHE